jgi:hypothetical protein
VESGVERSLIDRRGYPLDVGLEVHRRTEGLVDATTTVV